MFSAALVALVAASSVFAAPDPTTPGPTDSYTAGGVCTIAWDADVATTKAWTTMDIQLMTGINSQMTAMRTIATAIDATTQTTFNWTCPEVDPPAPIYFYQFSSSVAPTDLVWVTRFLIKETDGSSVAAPLTDPNGVAYGIGTFVDTTLYNAPPAYLSGNGQLVGSAGNGTTTSNTTSSGSTPAGTATSTGTGSTSATASITKITSPAGTSTSTSTAHTTASSGASAASFVSSPWGAILGAFMAVAAVAI